MSPVKHPPADVRRLAAERTEARSSREWERADALRARIRDLGWEVEDGPDGTRLRPTLADDPDVGAVPLAAPAQVALSIQVAAEDHPDDLARFLGGLSAHPPSVECELIIVANAPSFDLDAVLASASPAVAPHVTGREERLGWAESRTLGMRHSRGEVTLLLDTSLEPTGDFASPLLAAFDDPAVGIAGGWGVRSRNGRDFDDAPPGEVDAVEAYCLAVRRDAMREVGGFDPRFRYYRNADLDFSFAVRDAGWRAIRTDPLPLARHEHRGWSGLPDEERDRLSRRNFYRFLDRWRDRPDLLLERQAASGGR